MLIINQTFSNLAQMNENCIFFLFWMLFLTPESANLNIGSNRIELDHFGSNLIILDPSKFLIFKESLLKLAKITDNYVLFS